MAQAVAQQTTWQKWRGKVAGVTAGALVGGPLGALVGAALGHTYDRYFRALQKVETLYTEIEQPPAHGTPGTAGANEAAFTIGIIALGARLAQTSRRLNPQMIDHFRAAFRLPEKHMPMIRMMFEQALFDRVGFKPYAQQVAALFATRPQRLQELVEGLIRFARADGVMNAEVEDYLKEVASLFGISDAKFMQMMLANGAAPAVRDAYAVLGVPRTASAAEVKAAYRNLILNYHPDRLMIDGADDIAAANDRMAAINRAYSDVKKQQGWV